MAEAVVPSFVSSIPLNDGPSNMIKDEGANYILNDSSDQFQIKRDMVGPLNKVTVVILFITLIYI